MYRLPTFPTDNIVTVEQIMICSCILIFRISHRLDRHLTLYAAENVIDLIILPLHL